MKKLNILIIGAGGTASYFLPAISKYQGHDIRITLMDGDKLEEHNLDRQLFNKKSVGNYKAEELTKVYSSKRSIVNYVNEFLTPNTTQFISPNLDCVFSFVDNNNAVKLAYDRACHVGIPFIMAANEMFDASADIVLPEWRGTSRCLYSRYPDVLTPSASTGINCTGSQAAQFPQLAIANNTGAALAQHLFYTWIVSDFSEEARNVIPYSIKRTLSKFETRSIEDETN